MTEYWFARRFPVGHWRNAMAPVSPKARRIPQVFWSGVLVGTACFFGFGLAGSWRVGGLLWLLIGGAASWYYITEPPRRFDRNHTVEDYREGRVGQVTE